MNMSEYGNVLRVNANEDISGNTNTVIVKSPTPVVTELVLTSTEGVTVGASNITVKENGQDVTYNANEYIEYKFKEGEVFIAGDWEARLYSKNIADGTNKISKTPIIFTVDP